MYVAHTMYRKPYISNNKRKNEGRCGRFKGGIVPTVFYKDTLVTDVGYLTLNTLSRVPS